MCSLVSLALVKAIVLVAISLAACDETPLHPPGWTPDLESLVEPEPGRFLERAPGLEAVLDPRFPDDRIDETGLIETMLDRDGKPVVGDEQHQALTESELTYSLLNDLGEYAPDTFEAWKERFGFPPRQADETLAAWRARAQVYVYYNLNELGLGRELGCSEFPDQDADGEPATGVACFVTNYGATFANRDDSFADAVRGEPRRNTVCIAYIPSLAAGSQVQFFVYGASNARQSWAQLDHLGPRPHPFVCTGCHGGEHDTTTHLTRDAHFLPTQPSHLWFGPDAPYDRPSQEEFVRRANALAFGVEAAGDGDQKLTPEQRRWLAALYAHDGGDIHTPGQAIAPAWTPPEWSSNERDSDIWTEVVDRYCMTCHGALGRAARARFASPTKLEPYLAMSVCSSFSMPNAQQTSHRFWRAAPVTVAGTRYASAADALLAWAGIDRSDCSGLAAMKGCKRGGELDHALCGNDHSGTVCLPRGECGPDLDATPSHDYADPIGYCTVDGPRQCPAGQECRGLEQTTADGWSDGGCFVCGNAGRPPCLH